ncbi:NF-X1-type zinc finger protein NFXL2 [Acorus calamus]|uniref:NF-X1-type zinc finger protein NFXL2 n=1 Tax=Acorus calamus TaxID=4465 RepID=A0AAV9EI13_ACOCL|nr:NF-X1-type zinc finger protein NFXL2 [Acorus calamus]
MASAVSLPPPPPNPNLPFSAFDSDSDTASSDGDHHHSISTTTPSFTDTIFAAYLQISGPSTTTPSNLSKIHSFLISSRRGSLACLVCLERIRPSDPVWSCSPFGCHVLLHLLCIQNWAAQSSSTSSARSALRPSPSDDWHCPKCRLTYPRSSIPRAYLCFCGKVYDPPSDPWILPHSCGEICDRPLKNDCGHRCLLLCHPGPCPPCPKIVTVKCFCGSLEDVRRCAQKSFSCNSPCERLLPCRAHRCRETCHPEECPPCAVEGVYKCQCGEIEEKRKCFERDFQCDRPCGGALECGKHECGRGCHGGPCGECPLKGKRHCPCGKVERRGVMDCNAPVPTCGSTCEKVLGCGRHRCFERCHKGPCIETCRAVVIKSCRCGSLKKEVPCYQDLVCERKCQRVRDCGRHACRRRCCDGDCPPCPEICGRKLRCSNHKCPSPCHRGVCAPCPLMVSISCACGETHFEVPCGLEADQKPPRCPKPCPMSRLCRHASKSKPHKCHYGSCPPCRLVCEEKLLCGHACIKRCHGPTPPPMPEFTLKPKKKKFNKQSQGTPGSTCPPCQEIVLKSCLGEHMGSERSMLCSDKSRFSCGNFCGNLLQCGNHYCTKQCHVLMSILSVLPISESNENYSSRTITLTKTERQKLSEPCEECLLPCQKERDPACIHPCPLPCHSDDCAPCRVLIKRSCHCSSMVHVFECTYFNSLSDKGQQRARSCGGPCHRKLRNCPHLCSEICHPDHCPSSNKCLKKVTVRCPCHHLKNEWLCKDVQDAYRRTGRDPKDIIKRQFGIGLLPCNLECTSRQKVVESELQLRKPKVETPPTLDVGHATKRRKRRERIQEHKQISKLQAIQAIMWKCLVCVTVFVILVAIAYYGYKGLFLLSDWMNEAERRRLNKLHPKI